MDENIPRSTLWNKAGQAGFILGLATVSFMMLSTLTSTAFGNAERVGMGVLGGLVGILLWAGKLVVCFLLMRFFLKKLVSDHPSATHSDTLQYGVRIALLSSLIVVTYNIADVMLIHPGMYADAIRQMMEGFSSLMDSNTQDMLEKISGKVPVYAFVLIFLYDFIWGWILSAILSRDIPSRDPFRS